MYQNKLEFTIDGDVQPQERPRFSRRGGFVTTYDPPKSAKYKKYVAEVVSEHKLDELIDSAIRLTIDVHRRIPKSTTKKDLKLIEEGILYPTKKADLDNYLKSLLDGITASESIWRDDSLIVEIHARKIYSHEPKAHIIIEW